MGSSSVPSFDWAHVGSILFGILFVFGPVVVYVSPFLAINIRGSVDGFHPLISIILLAAHLMRIEFFLLRPYASIILFQSYVMIIAQVAMLLSVLTARLKERAAARCKHVGEPFRMCAADHVQFKGVALNSLIKVDYFVEIVGGIVIMLLFVAAVGIVNDKVLESRALTTSIGYLSLTTESILALPALIANWRSKSCGNMRLDFLALLFVGDLGKAIYFVFVKTDMPFLVCAFLQLAIDCTLAYQFFIYPSTAHQPPIILANGPAGSPWGKPPTWQAGSLSRPESPTMARRAGRGWDEDTQSSTDASREGSLRQSKSSLPFLLRRALSSHVTLYAC